MLAKTITYTDFNGVSRTETLYFNLTQAELTKMAYIDNKNLAETLTKAIDDKDTATIVRFMCDFIISAYGEKSDDGKYFHKSEEMRNKFANSAAYDALFAELLSDDEKAVAFINGVVPAALAATKPAAIELEAK